MFFIIFLVTFGNNPKYSALLTLSPETTEPDGKV